jgi:hypothetical protein
MMKNAKFLQRSAIVLATVGLSYSFYASNNNNHHHRWLDGGKLFRLPRILVAWNDKQKKSSEPIDENLLKSYRPDPNKYERIDDIIFRQEHAVLNDSMLHGHVLYSSLMGESRVECYEVYKPKDSNEEEIYCIIAFGDRLNGWPNIVHGGKQLDRFLIVRF